MKLIKAHATWCAPCKSLTAVMKTMDHNLMKDMESFDIDMDPTRASAYGIRSLPTLILIDDEGMVLKKLVGMQSKDQILEFLS